jgi:hypothetical protein
MSNGRRFALASLLLMLAGTDVNAASPAAQILHHEPVSIATQKSGGTQRVSFAAFGKHFDVALQPNERVRRALKADVNDVVPFRGTVDGMPHSWVRLTRSADGLYRGMVSDGQELYAIEPASDVQTMAVEPMQNTGSVMYRLKDLVVEWAPGFCEALPPGEKTTALETFKALGAEVVQAEAASGVPTRQASVGVVGDWEFATYFSNPLETPTQAVVTRMNVVDGIFSDQVGVTIEVPTIQIASSSSDAFTQADSKLLLDEVRAYRRGNGPQKVLALTHLMTGRDLGGDTVGIAYTGTVCDGEYAVSLSEGSRSTTMASLIAAHEIGHNFNAPHDGDSKYACASTPTTYLMAPQINYSDEFSACSLQQIQTKIATASCLTTYSPPDVAIEVAASTVQGVVNTALSVAFTVRSAGGSAAQNVSTTASLPGGLILNSSSASDGATCTTGAGAVSCIFGVMEAGAARTVTLNVTAATAATYPVNLTVESSNDADSSDNSGRIDVSITTTAAPVSPPASASSDGGGGGGALGFGVLGALLGLIALRAKRAAHANLSRR